MNDELGFQNMWIAAGVGVAGIIVGSIFLNNASESVQGLYCMACAFTVITLRHLLDGRKLRRLEREKAELPR
jgi:hypothetical protein